MKVYTLHSKHRLGIMSFTVNPTNPNEVIVEYKDFVSPIGNYKFYHTLVYARKVWRDSIKDGWVLN